MADIAAERQTFDEALVAVLDSLCDEVWPVGHVYKRVGDRFVDSSLWSSRARVDFPEFVDGVAGRVGSVSCHASALARKMSSAHDPVWLSLADGSAELGPASTATSPERARVLRESGFLTQIVGAVVVDQEAVALVELFSPRERHDAPDELETLRLVCSMLSGVAQRDRDARNIKQRNGLLRAIEDAIPDMLIVFDPETREVIEYSPGTLNRRPEVISMTVDEAFATSHLDWNGMSFEEVFELLERGPLTFNLVLDEPGFPPTPCEVMKTSSVVDGRGLEFVFIRDVSARDWARRDLAEASSRTQSLLEVADAGIFEIDESYRIVYVNTPGADLLGMSPDELAGRRLDELVPFLSGLLTCPDDEPVRRGVGRLPGLAESDASGDPFHGTAQPPLTLSAAVACRKGSPSGHRQIVTLSDVTAAESGALLAAQHAHAIDINDSVVQGLTAALYGLELGDVDSAIEALETTLREAKQTVATLLADTGITPEILRAVAGRNPAMTSLGRRMKRRTPDPDGRADIPTVTDGGASTDPEVSPIVGTGTGSGTGSGTDSGTGTERTK